MMQNHFSWDDPSESPFESIIKKLIELGPVELGPAAASPDFSKILVIVSGRQWIRNLKTALALRFPQGVFPPKILTPGGVLRYGLENLRCASSGEQLIVWEYILNRLKDSNIFSALSLRHDGDYSEKECRNLAKVFFSLRQELVQGGKTFADAEAILAGDKRWHALTSLESAFAAALKDFNLMDTAEASKCYVSQEAADMLSDEFSHIVVAFLPDMPKLLEEKLTQLRDRVTILVHGDEKSDADKFDAWGRPNEIWCKEKLPIKDGHLHSVANPEQAALLTLALATKDGAQPFDPEQSAIVLGKSGFFPAFESVFQKICYDGDPKQVTLFSPEDVPGLRLRIAQFLQKLCACLHDENDFAAFNALLRDEAFCGYLRNGTEISENQFLSDLDRFMLDALPDNVNSAIALRPQKTPYLETLFRKGKSVIQSLNTAADFCTELNKLLKSVFSRPGYPPIFGVSFDDEVDHWQEAVKKLRHSPLQEELLPKAEQKLRYLLQDCETASFHPGRDDDAILVYNFLEFPALMQPELILVGMNWGIVPAVRGTTPYLTNSIRKQLGLENYETLAALESYKLITLLKRKPDTHLLTLKFDENNTPLRPTGMLFTGCSEDELFVRARHCREAEIIKECTTAATEDHHFCLNLKNIVQQPFFQKDTLEFSVTDFKTYLNSPCLFLLQKVYKIDCPDYSNGELDASVFGSACHEGLEGLKNFKDIKFMTEDEYYRILIAGSDQYLQKEYGDSLPFLVKLQREQIYLRLKAAAKYFAATQDGYRLLEAEYKINGGNFIEFGGARIKGKIDRIEYSSETQTLRLIDIKTYNKAKTPEADHLKSNDFTNLQLPLYHQLLLKDDAFWNNNNLTKELVKIEAGYLLLTADSDIAELKLWEKDFLAWSGKAEEKVNEIVKQLKKFSKTGILPPESKSAEYYELEPLFVPNSKDAILTEEPIYV